MSGLDELRALAEQEDASEIESTPEVEPEVLEGELAEADPESKETEGEEVDEIDLQLDDEPQVTKHTPEQALVYKLTKEKKKRQEATTELERLKAENEALKAGQPAPQQPAQAPQDTLASQYGYPPVPIMYENGVNTPEDYQRAYNEWTRVTREIDAAKANQEQEVVNKNTQTKARAQRLAQRSAEFITANKIKPEMATDTIQAGVQGLDDALGIQGAALQILDNIGDGSDRLAYYLGKNPGALATAKELIQEDPTGIKVAQWATLTAGKLNRKNQHISKAPAPDEPLTPDGSSASSAKLQSDYDKAVGSSDMKKIMSIRAQARSQGITLS